MVEPADDGDIDRERPEEEPLLAGQLDHLHEVLGGGPLFAPGVPGVDVGVETHRRDQTGPAGRDLPTQLGKDTLGERICLDQALLDELTQTRLVSDVRADGPAHEARQGQLGESAVGEVADADNPHRGQVLGRPLRPIHLGQGVDEELGKGVTGPRPADDHSCPVGRGANRLFRCDQSHGACLLVALMACGPHRSDTESARDRGPRRP